MFKRILAKIKSWFNKPQPVVEVVTEKVTVVRLESEVFEDLERQVTNLVISSTTTDLEAGYKLGVQAVLSKLRKGYVITRS